MPAKRIDLTGKIFGKLTVLEYSHSDKYAYWKCRCECGKKTIVRSSHLIAGLVKSCGCIVSEIGKRSIKIAQNVNRKHDDSKTRLFTIWVNMRQRCINPGYTGYKDYGGRGIKVCQEWENYLVFREWALSNGYAENLTIDRIDVNGNYEPSNCRWSDKTTQANNTRRNVYITYCGETKSIAQWAKGIDVPISTFARWLKNGESFEHIILKKCGKNKGKQHNCEICGISFTSHSHKSKYCSDECSRIGENKAQQVRRKRKCATG